MFFTKLFRKTSTVPRFSLFLLLFILLNSSIINMQYNISFRCTIISFFFKEGNRKEKMGRNHKQGY